MFIYFFAAYSMCGLTFCIIISWCREEGVYLQLELRFAFVIVLWIKS